MLKKLTSLFISVLLIVTCMAVPVMADGEVNIPGGTTTAGATTATLNVKEAGNYRIKFNGTVEHTNKRDMTYLIEVTDNAETPQTQSIIGVAPYTGTGVKADSVAGDITLYEGKYTLTLTNLGGGASSDFTLSFERIGDENPEDTYTVLKSFGTKAQGGDVDARNYANSSSKTDEGIRANDFVKWNGIYLPYTGEYDIYLYGGVQSGTVGDMVSEISIAENVSGEPVVCTNSVYALWTGGTASGGKMSIFGEKFSDNAHGRNTRTLSKLCTVSLEKGKSYNIKFLQKSGSITFNEKENKLWLVRRSNDNYELTLKKKGKDCGNANVLFEKDEYAEWTEINVKHDGKYDVIYYGGAQAASEASMSLKFEIGDKSAQGNAMYTGAAGSNIYECAISNNIGARTLIKNRLGRVTLKKGTYDVKLTNLGGADAMDFEVILVKAEDYVKSDLYKFDGEIATLTDEIVNGKMKAVIELPEDLADVDVDDITMIFAIYEVSNNGEKLIKAETSNEKPDNKMEVTIDGIDCQTEKTYKARIFLLDGTDTLTPYCCTFGEVSTDF